MIWRVNLRRESGEVRTELPEPHAQVSEAVPKGTWRKLEGEDSALGAVSLPFGTGLKPKEQVGKEDG